jgi:hypothetical protein
MLIWTFLLRITHTLISQSIADSSWITLYINTHTFILGLFSSSRNRPDRPWDPRRLLFSGYRQLFFPGIKWPGRESDQSFPWSSEDTSGWNYTSFPVCLRALHRDSCNFNCVFTSKDFPRWTLLLVLLLGCGFRRIKYSSRRVGFSMNTRMNAGAIVHKVSIIFPSRINRLVCLFWIILIIV